MKSGMKQTTEVKADGKAPAGTRKRAANPGPAAVPMSYSRRTFRPVKPGEWPTCWITYTTYDCRDRPVRQETVPAVANRRRERRAKGGKT